MFSSITLSYQSRFISAATADNAAFLLHEGFMTAIKAIVTKYKGLEFRSRMEARTAVFLDALGIKWEYEKEGYELENRFFIPDMSESVDNLKKIKYLPDFYIPEQDRFHECFIEVKGKEPDYNENLKAILLCEATKLPVYFLWGFPNFTYGRRDECNEEHIGGVVYIDRSGSKHQTSGYKLLCEIELPGHVCFCKRGDRAFISHTEHYTENEHDLEWKVMQTCWKAYDKARNAKFEF